MDLKEITNEYERKEITKFLNNKPLVNVIKRLFLEPIYMGTLEPGADPEPRKNFVCQMLYTEDMGTEYAIENERIGQKVRASVEAIRLLEMGFAKLDAMKEVEKPKEAEEVSGR